MDKDGRNGTYRDNVMVVGSLGRKKDHLACGSLVKDGGAGFSRIGCYRQAPANIAGLAYTKHQGKGSG